MSRRDRKPLAKSRSPGDRPKGTTKGATPFRKKSGDRPQGNRPGGKPARFAEPRRERPAPFVPEPEKAVAEPPLLPTKVQTVIVTADENNMRVDRFLEARFPGLSFSHIQRIVRKGELRVNGKRADSKDRLEEG
ncbi:MAG TPA: S4 domain-containing protein, partial [Gemmataceae bacterium]|nr:S4 domain-containing protein [Gemmataceae bacterium]